MERIVLIGGVGSNRHLMKSVGKEMETFFSQPVEAFSFREIQQLIDVERKKLLDGAFVLTHSAGVIPLIGTKPKQFIAIAPPVPTHPLRLTLRSVPKTLNLLKSSRADSSRSQRVREFHRYALPEHIRFPRYNGIRVRTIGSFDVFEFANSMAEQGVAATIGLMEKEDLFSYGRLGVALHSDVTVYEKLPGAHDDFVLDPTPILRTLFSESHLQ